MDEFVGRVAVDTRINSFFAATAAAPQRLASGALNKFKVGEMEKSELLGVMGPRKPQIVEK